MLAAEVPSLAGAGAVTDVEAQVAVDGLGLDLAVRGEPDAGGGNAARAVSKRILAEAVVTEIEREPAPEGEALARPVELSVQPQWARARSASEVDGRTRGRPAAWGHGPLMSSPRFTLPSPALLSPRRRPGP